jgi:FkbM family methyltransferase
MRSPARIAKDAAIRLLGRYHRRVVYMPPTGAHGVDLAHDLRIVVSNPAPMCLDIGANAGQTIEMLQRVFPAAQIHAFEPSARMSLELEMRRFGERVSVHRLALGRVASQREFLNYDTPLLSSFLLMDRAPENRFRDAVVRNTEVVEIDTVDRFLSTRGIEVVDLMKSDTQGFESEVLAGSTQSMQAGRIRAVLVELNFVRMYQHQASPTDIMATLIASGLYPVGFYELEREANTIGWCTALFSKRLKTA